jgi:hypothetical protein
MQGRRITVPGGPQVKTKTLFESKTKMDGDVTQVVELVLTRCKTLNSKFRTTNKQINTSS